MRVGDTLADRFRVEGLAGTGGVATVFRATDTTDGSVVALKVLGAREGPDVERFTREARVLSELSHPGIVRYVAHGRTPSGDYYLAMGFLEGETLSARLRRSGLTVAESVKLLRTIAEPLAVAHAHGVVHRDLKPSNLFLQGGDLGAAKILDFGVARLGSASLENTRTGLILGTPGYMAPEQARGDREVGPEADIFSLGCVLFECLTGAPPFSGQGLVTVLAKILIEEAPHVSERRPEVSPALDALVARMLAKSPGDRPRDARALADALALIEVAPGAPAPPSLAPPAITATEQRLLCVILASDVPSTRAHEPSGPAAARLRASRAATDDAGELVAGLRAAVAPFGGRIDVLAGGSVLWSLAGEGVASDQAAQAARCALAIRELLPQTPMALATGRALLAEQWSMGEVIDRAARILGTAPKSAPPGSGIAEPIRIDGVTAGLLSARFEVGGDDAGLALRSVRDVIEPTRTLLGKATPCVGRDRELATLESLYAECVSEPVARVVLVTAAAGMGKSRLRYELVRRLREKEPGLEVWSGRGDPMKVGSPFGMLAPAIRRAAGILDGEPSVVGEHKLRARVGRNVPASDVGRVSAFLGELCNVPVTESGEGDGSQLRAARRDPQLMGDQMQKAWEDWLAAECRAQPVLLLLEDLHWGDLPTVKFVDAALRNLQGLPFMVVALARPEVHDLFPKLWEGRGLEEIRLKELTRKASESLVRQVLGDALAPDLVAQLVAHAEGNALFLEELVRSVAETGSTALPETVIAMVQARLERVEPEGRRVLRAASVFGQVFWRGGVQALLGRVTSTETTVRPRAEPRRTDVDEWLDELARREIVTRRAQSRFPREDEFLFRHSLVREASYAMLPDTDRHVGHRLAAEWLEAVGERDATVLAEHFERGGVAARAVGWYGLAAEDALEGNDLAAAMDRANRGIACGATGEELGTLTLLLAEVHHWRGARQEATTAALASMKLLPRGGDPWYAAVAIAMSSSMRQGDLARVVSLAEDLPPIDVGAELVPAQIVMHARAVGNLLQAGRAPLAERLLAPLAALLEGERRVGPEVIGWIENALAWRALFAGDTGESLKFDEAAGRSFELAGDARNACLQRAGAGYEQILLGAFAEAEATLREVLASATRMGLDAPAINARHNLGLVLARRGAFEEAIAFENEAIEAYTRLGDTKLSAASEHYLALIYLLKGDLEAAERAADRCLTSLHAFPPHRPRSLATSARIRLEQRRPHEARAFATEAMAALEAQGSVEDGEALIRLTYAEALHADGAPDEARAAILEARARVLRTAEKIRDPALQRSFLERVPENARTLALAAEWSS